MAASSAATIEMETTAKRANAASRLMAKESPSRVMVGVAESSSQELSDNKETRLVLPDSIQRALASQKMSSIWRLSVREPIRES
jgi:hypothetical protein